MDVCSLKSRQQMLPAFENQFADLPFNKIGEVTADPVLKIANVEIPVEELVQAFNAIRNL